MSEKRPDHIDAVIKIGLAEIAIRKTGDSRTIVAKILGRQAIEEDGTIRLTLDRLVHGSAHSTIGTRSDPWPITGCYVSEITCPATSIAQSSPS